MTISPRLTRAALAFLLFGTAAALLPSQDMAALAVNGCFTGPAGGTGKFAVAPSMSSIRDSYSLTSPATTYNFYFQSPTSSSYTTVGTHLNTIVTVTSGKVNINGAPYTANGSVNVTTTSSSFTLTKTPITKFGNPTGTYESGSVSVVSTYSDTDTQGNKTVYTANITASNP